MMINKFDTVRQDLYRRFGHVCESQTIDAILDGVIADHTAKAKVLDFLPVLVARDAAEQIQDHIWSSGDIGTPRKRILFVSERNAGRSKFAVAIARHLSDNGVVATSAGTHPENGIDHKVEWVLDERGLNVPEKTLHDSDERTVNAADVIVMMGVEETPTAPGMRYVHWNIDDPSGRSLEEVRDLCDEIEMSVFNLLIEMGVPMTARTAATLQAA